MIEWPVNILFEWVLNYFVLFLDFKVDFFEKDFYKETLKSIKAPSIDNFLSLFIFGNIFSPLSIFSFEFEIKILSF